MYKTIIFRLEGVILNEEILKFKIYEILWYYLRRNPEYRNFRQIMEMRNKYSKMSGTIPPYHQIIRMHLSEIDQTNIMKEIALLEKKMSNRYLRKVPGMTAVIQNLRYYYKIFLLARDSIVTRNAVKKFGWNNEIFYIKSGDTGLHPTHLQETFHQILKISRTSPAETIFISEVDFPDIRLAQQSGFSTIQTEYSFRVKGFTPQNIMEREYVNKIEGKSDRWSMPLLTSGHFQVLKSPGDTEDSIKTPQDLVKSIEDLEESRPNTPQYQNNEKEINIWEVAKKIFNPPMDSE